MRGGEFIKCKRCGNDNPNLFYLKNGKYYCRACVQFKGRVSNLKANIKPKIVRAKINYYLSSEQKIIAKKIFDEENEIYVKAVCGAGKTECVFSSIEKALQEGKRVGFATPRKEVVKEIFERLKDVFKGAKVISVYGGNTSVLEGDIIVFTTHQSYRYQKAFGLLIIDEYDAFPFKNNQVLLTLTKNTSIKKIVYLSATFLDEEIKEETNVTLNKRFHKICVPVPKIIKANFIFQIINLIKLIKNTHQDYSLLIFVPTISLGKRISKFLSILRIRTLLFTSKSNDKATLFKLIKNKNYRVIVTTTILERGITFEKVNVVILCGDDKVFDHRCIIQIAGRVGRKKDSPTGEVIIFTKKITFEIKKAINEITLSNRLIK